MNNLQVYTAAKHLLEIAGREHSQEAIHRGFEVLKSAVDEFEKSFQLDNEVTTNE